MPLSFFLGKICSHQITLRTWNQYKLKFQPNVPIQKNTPPTLKHFILSKHIEAQKTPNA